MASRSSSPTKVSPDVPNPSVDLGLVDQPTETRWLRVESKTLEPIVSANACFLTQSISTTFDCYA